MEKKVHHMTHAAIIGALYAVLTHMQNILLPNSASMAIQFRLSEALCVLALFTPAAPMGLTIGCLIFNLTFAAALPLDWVLGSLSTLLAARSIRRTRNITCKGFPVLALTMPALYNGVLVGWELTMYIGGGWAVNAMYVAIGELAVMFTLGAILYSALKHRNLGVRLFGRDEIRSAP